MATRKNYRADNTYLISNDSTDNPKLGAKVLNDGRESLYLDYYFGYEVTTSRDGKEYAHANRRREFLKLYLWQAPRTQEERQRNKETLELAKKIRFERGQQLLDTAKGYRLKKSDDLNFLDWMRAYYEDYTKADKRQIKQAYTRFMGFLMETEEYAKYSKRMKPQQLTKEMVEDFTEYLKHKFKGEGPHSLFARFKKMLKAATEQEVLRKNPADGVVIKIDRGRLRKDILSLEEIKRLAATHYEGENLNIRRAFLFCLYCGLRWCDVKDLTFENVDYSNRLLRFEQAKTKGHSSASSVVIPLNDTLLQLIGQPAPDGKRNDAIFPLPTNNSCQKSLRRWTKRAGIDKHITWHCARHSFAVNILNNGANIKTVASLLGHSGLQHTEKYTRAVDSLKEAAINSLPKLEI